MKDFQKIFTSFFWNHIGRIAEYFLVYLFTILIARFLGAAVNGTYALLLSITQLFLLFSSFGLEIAAVSYLPKIAADLPKQSFIIRNLLIVRVSLILFFGVALLLFSNTFFTLLNIPAEVHSYLFIIIPYFCFQSITSLVSSILLSSFKTKTPALIKVSARSVELAGAYYLLSQGYGLRAVFILISATSFITMVSFVILSLPAVMSNPAKRGEMSASGAMPPCGTSKRKRAFGMTTAGSESRALLAPILSFGGLIWINGLLEFILSKQTDIFLLNYYFNDASMVGYYDVATNFAQLISIGLTTGMYGISVASFSSLSRGKPSLLQEYWHFLNRTILLVLLPAFIGCIWFAGALIPMLYSNAYLAGIILFQVFGIFLIGTRLLGGGIAATYIQSTVRPAVLLISSAVSGAVNLVFAIILIPKYGAMGAIFATGLGMLSIAAIHGYIVCKSLQVSFQIRFAAMIVTMALFILAVTSTVIGWTGSAYPILSLFTFAVLYILILILIKPLQNTDIKFFGSLPPVVMSWIQLFVSAPQMYRTLTDRQKWAFRWMPQSETTVDVGSSVSPLLNLLPLKSKNIIAIDIDRAALAEVAAKRSDIKVIESSSSQIPLNDESCDTVLLLDVLEHVSDEQQTIEEIWRILKPNGTLILSVPHKGLFQFLDPQNLKARLTNIVSKETEHRHYSEPELMILLGGKFSIIKKHFGGLFLYPITFAANNFVNTRLGLDWGTFFKKIGDWDNDLSWGRWSYNLILCAVKKVE